MTHYKQGQNVACRVNYAEKDGYAVTIIKDNRPGFIKTANVLRPGDEILGVFVCVHNGRILLSQLFSAPRANLEQLRQTTVNWEEHLNDDDLDAAYEAQAATSASQDKSGDKIGNKWQDRVESTGAKIRYQRACDLFMPPVDLKSIRNTKIFKMADHDLDWLITDLEGGCRTACIKTQSKNHSRSASLLYRGRIVGCYHHSRESPSSACTTEVALSGLLGDLDQPETKVTVYDLPEAIVFSMSSLFLGSPLNLEGENTVSDHYDLIMENVARRKRSACLTILAGWPVETRLVLVHRGQLVGVFNVEDQLFFRDENSLNDLFERFPQAVIEASVAGSNTEKSAKRYGYSLSVANQERRSL